MYIINNVPFISHSQEAVLDLFSNKVTILMDFSCEGCLLGRVYISVMADIPYGRQLLMLTLWTHGPSYKGAKFVYKKKYCIGLYDYVTGNEILTNDPLLTTLVDKKHYDDTLREFFLYVLNLLHLL